MAQVKYDGTDHDLYPELWTSLSDETEVKTPAVMRNGKQVSAGPKREYFCKGSSGRKSHRVRQQQLQNMHLVRLRKQAYTRMRD